MLLCEWILSTYIEDIGFVLHKNIYKCCTLNTHKRATNVAMHHYFKHCVDFECTFILRVESWMSWSNLIFTLLSQSDLKQNYFFKEPQWKWRIYFERVWSDLNFKSKLVVRWLVKKLLFQILCTNKSWVVFVVLFVTNSVFLRF